MKILVIPDVHGRKFWHKAEDIIDNYEKVVFLGDYLDPYPHEYIYFDTALKELQSIINFKRNHNDKVITLLGNHDLHYMHSDVYPCWRYNRLFADKANELLSELNPIIIHIIDNCLFSHAGVTPEWLENNKLTIDQLKTASLDSIVFELQNVGIIRGGFDKVGSCVWCDVREFMASKYKGLPYYQIFGHTQLQHDPIVTETFACLDCRQIFEVDTETKEIKML